ncbi:hypothetical protein V5799_018936 [Amblyomma americanum]|uniref:Uncharacterized protein n=1 Tax=Amblyomma americanum TaxID=6943 RepID=A0AAQ4EZ67_AMBAM
MNVAGITAPFSSMSQLVRSSQSLRSHRDTAFGSFEEFLGAPTSEPPLSGHQTAFAVVVTTVRIVSDATLSTVASSHGSGKHEGSAATLAPPSTSSSSVCFRTVTLVWPLVLLGGAAAAVITLVPILFLGNVMGEDPSFEPPWPFFRGPLPEELLVRQLHDEGTAMPQTVTAAGAPTTGTASLGRPVPEASSRP